MSDPFYVGYLPLPKRLRLPLLGILAALFVADIALAVLVVRAQPAHASGAWGTDGEVKYDGVFQARPYPLLHVVDQGGVHTILLVSEGKHGAPDGLDALNGKHAAAWGYPVQRGDLTVLQLDRDPAAQDGPAPSLPSTADPAPATLTGEIVDAKCWAGAMNPGDGKAHKACGSLCLLGGIPALFIADAPDGGAHWYLLSTPGGGPVDESARRVVGERLTLAGTVTSASGLATFAVDLNGGAS